MLLTRYKPNSIIIDTTQTKKQNPTPIPFAVSCAKRLKGLIRSIRVIRG